MTKVLDTNRCPMCNQVNHCDVVNASQCWCMNTTVPNALIARLPEELQGKSCLCAACIEKCSQSQSQSQSDAIVMNAAK